jgi:spermidine synthase
MTDHRHSKDLTPIQVAFHTWPKDGVIAMDLFTCGAGLLIPVLPMIKRLFGIPGLDFPQEPLMKWSHKLRGFREDFSLGYNRHENPLEQDLSRDILANHRLMTKNVLLSGQTSFQHVDVIEWHDPSKRSPDSYERSLSDDGHEILHPGMFRLDKGLHLDGVQQSSLYGEAAYHEALVHPGMFAHSNPKRVAIIGGGEGATLREILKHKSVTMVEMVEIDEKLVKICQEHMPEWSDCSDMEGSDADSCFDDSRASVEFIDAFAWFIESFGKEDIQDEKFDVIIMDALDPDKFVSIVGSLYKDNTFTNALYNGLSDGGVVSMRKRMSTLSCIAFISNFSCDLLHLLSVCGPTWRVRSTHGPCGRCGPRQR